MDGEFELSPDLVEELTQEAAHRRVVQADGARVIQTVTAADMGGTLPDLDYLCESLSLARGNVGIVAGYGYSGKTMFLQSLAISLASEKPILGVWSRFKRARVLHIDCFEQGQRLSSQKYQRLTRGFGFELADLGDQLQLASHPVYLSDPNGPKAIGKLIEDTGAEFVFCDSLRSLTPGADENSSEIREHIDALRESANKTGAVIALIDHAKKPSETSKGGDKFSLRGSSAKFDACDFVFILHKEEGGNETLVRHHKERNTGREMADFGFRVEDVEIDGKPNAGLRLVHLDKEQMVKVDADAGLAPYLAKVKAWLSANPSFAGNKTALALAVGGKRTNTLAAISVLVASGELIEGKNGQLKPQ